MVFKDWARPAKCREGKSINPTGLRVHANLDADGAMCLNDERCQTIAPRFLVSCSGAHAFAPLGAAGCWLC